MQMFRTVSLKMNVHSPDRLLERAGSEQACWIFGESELLQLARRVFDPDSQSVPGGRSDGSGDRG